ncbi:MAG: DUF421 domain-containing protein [Alicyclobacillus sp.]|nr:DUF421 domain-containing protein [Alicyclobacillus sp.]
MPTTHEVLYQSVIAFVLLFGLARLLGKRQIAQLSFFDYIVGITIGNIAASWSLDEVKTRHAVITLAIWALLSLLVAWVQRKSYRARLLLDGRPTVVIENGQVLEDNLRKVHLSIEELMLLLREKDVFKLADVEYAVLELNGKLSVMKKTDRQPVTPKDAGVPVLAESAPRLVIIDGHVMERSLAQCGLTKEWLFGEIQKLGARGFEDVFVAQVDSHGNVYADLYHDRRKEPEIPAKALLAASLKKMQADLETFALETQNAEAKRSYADMAQQLQQIANRLSPYLKD